MARLAKVTLYAPPLYWEMYHKTPERLEEIVNGCGPKFFGFLVPDTVAGVNFTPACNIHDFMYHYGLTQLDKDVADRAFKNNLVRLVRACTDVSTEEGRELFKKRLAIADLYYEAVAKWGGPAYWAGKNKDAEEYEIEVEVA